MVILNLDWRQGRIAKKQQSKPKENSPLDHGADDFISRKNRLPVALKRIPGKKKCKLFISFSRENDIPKNKFLF